MQIFVMMALRPYMMLSDVMSCRRPSYRFIEHFFHNGRIDARKYFFSSRVITIWNQLPAEVFNAVTVAAFVAKLRSCDLSRYLL